MKPPVPFIELVNLGASTEAALGFQAGEVELDQLELEMDGFVRLPARKPIGGIANCGRPLASFSETYRTAFDFLASPCKLWRSERIEDRRAVLKLVFA